MSGWRRTIVIVRDHDGKMRVTSGSWDGERVILRDQVLEVRNVDGRLHVARKARKPDEWDPPVEARDPCRPGTEVDYDSNVFVDWRRIKTRAMTTPVV
ncbi:MAG: hypothetical protein WA728_16970, partial [Xanthobacteraceae bacterium]